MLIQPFDRKLYNEARALRVCGEADQEPHLLRDAAHLFFKLRMFRAMYDCLDMAREFSNHAGAASGEVDTIFERSMPVSRDAVDNLAAPLLEAEDD